jgi:hypothetical protein
VLATSDGEDDNNKSIDERPDESRNSVEVMAEKLKTQSGGVVDCDVISNDSEDK